MLDRFCLESQNCFVCVIGLHSNNEQIQFTKLNRAVSVSSVSLDTYLGYNNFM